MNDDLKILKQNCGKNIAFSPLTLNQCLRLLEKASGGKTQQQIADVFEETDLPVYHNIDKVFNCCSALFVNENKERFIKEEFIRNVCEPNRVEVVIDSFKTVDGINDWFNKKTFGMIPHAISDISHEADVIISSVIALDMQWKEHYFGSSYGTYPFFLNDGSRIFAPRLEIDHLSAHVGLKETDDLTVVSLDLKAYGDLQFETVLLMPGNLEQYIHNHSYEDILHDATGLTPLYELQESVSIVMPSFHIDSEIDMKKLLIEQGVRDIFDPERSDLSGMFTDGGFVTAIKQHSVFIFNTKGVRAASCTSGIIKIFDMPEEKRTVCINHPFLCLLKDKKTGNTILIGTVFEPDCIKIGGVDGFESASVVHDEEDEYYDL